MKLRYKIITIVNVVHRNTELSQNDALVHIYTMVLLRETNTITNRYMYTEKLAIEATSIQSSNLPYHSCILTVFDQRNFEKMARHLRKPVR